MTSRTSLRVVHAAEPGGVQVLSLMLLRVDGAATSGVHAQVGEAEGALNRSLRDGDVLDVGEGDGHFPNDHDAFANAQAAVGDDVPPLLEIQPNQRQGEEAQCNHDGERDTGNQEQQESGWVALARRHERAHDGPDHRR